MTTAYTWQIWSRDRNRRGNDAGDYFVDSYKDKATARARATRLRKSHPGVMYFLKRAKVPKRFQTNPRSKHALRKLLPAQYRR